MVLAESGFSSPRNDAFPAGLRVLVVDDDPTWLKILEKMLKKCSYEVTTCCLAREALNLLRERKDGYDIVISDVNMPDMDGFILLEHVGLEMDLPVIMMSVDGETSRVMKGVQHGACDYLLKPIRMKELRNIWQHVFRKKIHEVRDIESLEGFESIQMTRSGYDLFDDGHFLSGDDTTSGRKRKDADNKHDDRELSDPSSTKKARVVWTVDLHQKFVKAVNQIGFDVGPKKILDLMNVPWLTRENVASHLQQLPLPGPSMIENEANRSRIEVKPLLDDCRSNFVEHLGPVGAEDLFPIQSKSQSLNNQVFDLISATKSSMKTQDVGLNYLADSEFALRNLNASGVGVPLATLSEDLQICWLQGDCYPMNYGLQDLECSTYDNPALMAETPFHLYDVLRFDHEHLFDPAEYYAIDQGLFA
ncbi:hypothetical protein GOBAR_AA07105 [Gossypium barbadense]|uniref:Response regulatory domain-containing protein n=1 Tax=Gossypium barbadense TaxID=3634 RepID=A0A2P5YCZ8_GOSBA|nr:hypothetical protein GOBAR_AA07105 [Gossypium barbadense]